MKNLIVASGNKGKIKEIKEILAGEYNVISMAELGYSEDIEETGLTFLENAIIKAKAVSKYFNEDALADDSGLMVDALKGAPGVFSARYSGDGATDESNRKLLLKNLQGVNNRSAKFVCNMVLYKKDGSYISSSGETYGEILLSERGVNGFGYDSLFFSNDLNKCFGEATAEEKNAVSHRYRALIKLKEKVKNERI